METKLIEQENGTEKENQIADQHYDDADNLEAQGVDVPAWQKYLLRSGSYKDITDFYLAKFNELGVKEHKDCINPPYPLNDIGLAKLFRDIHGDVIISVLEAKNYYVFDGTRHKPNSDLAAEICKIFSEALVAHANLVRGTTLVPKAKGFKDFATYAAEFHKHSRRKSLLADAATIAPVSAEIFDSNPWLINLKNGTYDLQRRIFREHRPGDYLTKICRAEYNPDVVYEPWSKFVSEIMEEDSHKISYLQKCSGYAFSGDVSQECFIVHYGPKTRNGKTTFCGAVEYTLGDYAVTAQPQTIAKRNTDGAASSSDLARLKGARLVNIPEPPQGLELNEALVKQMTGGESITARFLKANPIQFLPSFKIVIPTNHMPKITDTSLLRSGRMKVIQFNRSFADNPDTDLKTKFREPEAMSRIINWLIEGYRLYAEDGHLEPPGTLKAELDSFHVEATGQLDEFLRENLVEKAGEKVQISALNRRHTKWAQDSGLKTLTKHAFKLELESRYGKNVSRDGKLGNVLKGYQMVDELVKSKSPSKK